MKNTGKDTHPNTDWNKKNLIQRYTLSNKENVPKVTRVLLGTSKSFFSDETQQNHFSLLQNLRTFYKNKHKSRVMTKNKTKVTEIILPDERTHQKKRIFSKQKTPIFYRKARFKKRRFWNRFFWRNPGCGVQLRDFCRRTTCFGVGWL